MSNTITNNNTPALTVDQLWSLIDLAFPVKTQGFRYTDNGMFYCPSRKLQRYNPEMREWSVDEIMKLKAIVKNFGYSVRIGEGSGKGFWPVVELTAE